MGDVDGHFLFIVENAEPNLALRMDGSQYETSAVNNFDSIYDANASNNEVGCITPESDNTGQKAMLTSSAQQVMVSPLLEATNQGIKNLPSTSRSENSKRDSNKKQKRSTSGDRIKEFLEEQLGKDNSNQYHKYKYNDKEGTTKIFTRDIEIIDGDSFYVIWENENLPTMLATVMWSLRMIYLEENQRNEFKKYFKIHPPSNARIRIDILRNSNKLQTMMKNQKIELRRIFNCEYYKDSRINRKAKSRDKTHQKTKENMEPLLSSSLEKKAPIPAYYQNDNNDSFEVDNPNLLAPNNTTVRNGSFPFTAYLGYPGLDLNAPMIIQHPSPDCMPLIPNTDGLSLQVIVIALLVTNQNFQSRSPVYTDSNRSIQITTPPPYVLFENPINEEDGYYLNDLLPPSQASHKEQQSTDSENQFTDDSTSTVDINHSSELAEERMLVSSNTDQNNYTQPDINTETPAEEQFVSTFKAISLIPSAFQQSKETMSTTITSTCHRHNLPKLSEAAADLLPRAEYRRKLRQLLLTSNKANDNMVILNGPRGCGLTTLACMVCQGYPFYDNVREKYSDKDLEDRFIDGIYWFSLSTDLINVTTNLFNSLKMIVQGNDIKASILQAVSVLAKKKVLIILDDVRTLEFVQQLLPVVDQLEGHPTVTLLIITSALRSFNSAKMCAVDYLARDEANELFYRISNLDREQLICNTFCFNLYVEKLLAYCNGHTFALSLIADYISKIEDKQEKMERLPTIVGWLEAGNMDQLGSYHNGRRINLKEYLITCCPEHNSVLNKIKQLALFPGGCCIPLKALNWIWSTKINGDTMHYVDILINNFLLFKEDNGSFSLPYLFYLLMRNLCDQDWLSRMEHEKYEALRDDSFGSYAWLKKNLDTLGIDTFITRHFNFLEKNTDSSDIQTYLAHAYTLMFSEPRTVDAVKKNLDKVVQYVERQLDELLREIQTILQSLAAPCGVLLCLSSLPSIVDFILNEHEADNYHQGVSRFTANYLEHIGREVLRFSGAYEFFKRLHQEWSQYDGAAESLESREPKSTKEEVTSRS